MTVSRFGKTFIALVLFKLAYFGLISAALCIWPENFDETTATLIRLNWFDSANTRWQDQYQERFARHFATWDALHYLYLSEHGYASGVKSAAFYPLWPLLIGWCSSITGGNHLLAGLLLANTFSLFAWTLFYVVVAERFCEAAARAALVLWIAFPGALFFQFIYTESLFVFLLILLWFGLERERYSIAWAAAVLLPLTRAIGIFCLLPIAWHSLVRLCSAEGEIRNGDRIISASTWCRSACALLPLAPLLGFVLYLSVMWHWTGDPFEGMEAQKFWKAHSVRNLRNVPKFVAEFLQPNEWHSFRGSLLDRGAFLLLLYALPLIWRLGTTMLLWTFVLGFVPAMSGTFVSFTRFEAVVLPLFVALGCFFVERKEWWFRTTWIVMLLTMSLLHILLLWRFLNYRWAG